MEDKNAVCKCSNCNKNMTEYEYWLSENQIPGICPHCMDILLGMAENDFEIE